MKLAKVRFFGSNKLYTYAVPVGMMVEVNEGVVVKTPKEFKVVIVEELYEEEDMSKLGFPLEYLKELVMTEFQLTCLAISLDSFQAMQIEMEFEKFLENTFGPTFINDVMKED